MNLKNNPHEMFDFFEMTPDLVCIAGKDGFFRKINPAVEKKLGYNKEELYSTPIANFIHSDDREMTARMRHKLLEGEALINFQNRYVAKDETIIWLEWTSIYIPEREVVFAIAKDITLRKKKENEIEEKYRKFKGLATHFKKSLEEDRKNLADELHEDLAQLATVVKMDVHWVKDCLPGTTDSLIKERLEHALMISDLLISTIRRISFSISPGMLFDIGLNEVLEWQCHEFSHLSGIPCYFEYDYDESVLPMDIKEDLFRICQDSLSVIMHRGGAKEVWISIKALEDKIYLSVTDKNNGISQDESMGNTFMSRIRERAASVNGEFKISTEQGKGTTINVVIGQSAGE